MIRVPNKDARGKYSNARTGTYYMAHPEKFMGDEFPIYKSRLEFLFMRYADT